LKNPDAREHMFEGTETILGLLRQQISPTVTEAQYDPELLRNRMANELMHEVIPVLLHEDDLNSMYWSVENRSPYLDCELVEFAYSIPSEHLIQDGYAKWPLRAAVEGMLPNQIRLDKQKRGFNGSITTLVDFSDARTRERLFAPGPIFDIIDREAMIRFVGQSDLSDSTISKFLFSFATTRAFLDLHG
jgi:asparagine synthase (glutamine-hydrolysing)